jgi:D-beta-D-heptose 7-phosphate kinase/D-beta-D-heptose 1-phosphate adenosyltransferase
VIHSEFIQSKIYQLPQLLQKVAQWRIHNKKIVFTNGVFDILHPGHLASLVQASEEGDYLIVAVNSDSSVKRLKGDSRPLHGQDARASVLAALLMTDAVTIFEEDTPLDLIKAIRPDVLVKGGDYKVEDIAGSKEVIESGGRVVINPIVEGWSTTNIIKGMTNKSEI